MSDPEAVQLLYQHLAALPDPECGHINLLPFAQDSAAVNAVKRRVCEAIIRVFEDGGYPLSRERNDEVAMPRLITIRCRSCDAVLLTAPIDKTTGVSSLPAGNVISALAKMNPACPHETLTLDDHRRRIEEALLEGAEN